MDEQHRHDPHRHQPPPRPPGPPPPAPGPQRIPVPQPTEAEKAREREARKRAAKRAHEEHVKESTVPTWGRDIRRVVSYSAIGVVFAWVLILLVRWRLLRDNSHDIVEDTDVWTALVAVLIPFVMPFVLLAPKRPDMGFRRGTVPFLPLAALVSVGIQWLGMLAWPFLVGEDLGTYTVLATLGSDVVSFVTAAALIATWTCVFLIVTTALVTASETMKWVLALVLLIPYLGALFGAGFTSVRTFDDVASPVVALVWVGLAIVSFVLLVGWDLLRNLILRRAEGERDRSSRERRRQQSHGASGPWSEGPDGRRPSLEELGWNPQ